MKSKQVVSRGRNGLANYVGLNGGLGGVNGEETELRAQSSELRPEASAEVAGSAPAAEFSSAAARPIPLPFGRGSFDCAPGKRIAPLERSAAALRSG